MTDYKPPNVVMCSCRTPLSITVEGVRKCFICKLPTRYQGLPPASTKCPVCHKVVPIFETELCGGVCKECIDYSTT